MGVGQDGLPSPLASPLHMENGLYLPEGACDTPSPAELERLAETSQSPGLGSRSKAPPGRPPDRGKGAPSLLRRPCYYLSAFVKALPVIFISVIVGWSYYAYVVAVVLTAMAHSPVEQVVCAVAFHCLAVLFFWSYAMVVFTPPGVVPDAWRLEPEAVERLRGATSEEEWKALLAATSAALGCTVKQRSVQNAVRYCEKCLCIKPDRSHHCSVCEDCTLKMDHHCPWVNNCVGFHNYKFFLLFLGYAVAYCLWIAATTFRFFLKIWLYREEELVEGAAKYHILIVFFVSIMFSLSVSSLFWYHLWLLVHNRSTLEQFRAPMFENNQSDAAGWSLGRMNNVREVLGSSPLLWLLPVPTTLGDGIVFPTRVQLPDCTTFHSIGQSLPSRPETPTRTLINPVLGKDGAPSCAAPPGGSLSPECRLTITPDSGVALTEAPAAMEVRLDSMGHPRSMVVVSDQET